MSTDQSDEPTEASLKTIFYRAEQVRFIRWGEFSTGRATVGLVALVTIITFITGLSTMSQEEIVLDGPLADFLPDISTIIRFMGVLSAFVLGVILFGMNRKKRVAWYAVLIILPLIGILPLLTLESTHVPILVLVLITIPIVILNQQYFSEPLDLTPLQIAALASIGAALSYGTIGSYAIRDQFHDLHTWSDAVYYVLVTIATVGYGDITPLTSQAKWFSLSVIIFGTGAFTVAIGALIVPAIEKRMASAFGTMTPSTLKLLEDHVLVLGYSDITDALLDELANQVDIVVITPNTEAVASLRDESISVLTGDPTDEETLLDAGVDRAKGVVVATWDDAEDVLAVLATRKVNNDIRIVAAAKHARNADKLEHVGANQVISPATIGGKLLGRAVLGTQDEQDIFEFLK